LVLVFFFLVHGSICFCFGSPLFLVLPSSLIRCGGAVGVAAGERDNSGQGVDGLHSGG